MNKIPPKLKEQLAEDPEYKVCARHKDGGCDGRITWEHSMIFAGRQIQERFAIIPLCEYHHAVNTHLDGRGLDKQKNIWIALNRATDEELRNYSKATDYLAMRERLNKIYGTY
jgi:hypothetical protein